MFYKKHHPEAGVTILDTFHLPITMDSPSSKPATSQSLSNPFPLDENQDVVSVGYSEE
jgi:hypothetical protein